MISTAKLLASWTEASRGPYGERLARLLQDIVESDELGEDSVGQRNCRLLRLHRDLAGGPLEASVACAGCSTDNEFVVPSDAILATPQPLPDACVKLRVRSATLTFRLPRMKDLDGRAREGVAALCRIAGTGKMSEAALERLGRKFERLDPAANVVVQLKCSQCRHRIAATVDVATFVGRELDRIVDRLLREIDVIAYAYGWSEEAILALSARRRRLYSEMIVSRAPAPLRVAGARQ